MSGMVVRGHAMALVKDSLDDPTRSDVFAAISKVDARIPQFFHDVALEAPLGNDERYRRAAAVLFQYTAVQLADDLADSECSYLTPAHRVGPGVQWLLQHLYLRMLVETNVPALVLRASSDDFLQVGHGQQQEVRTTCWTLQQSCDAAACLNGRQYSGYLRLLWSGTELEHAAGPAGGDFGFALHVVGDLLSGDARWTTLEKDGQRSLCDLALAAVRRLSHYPSVALRKHGEPLEQVLTTARGLLEQARDSESSPLT